MSGNSGYFVEIRNDVTDIPPHTFLFITGPGLPPQGEGWGFAPASSNAPFAPGQIYDNTGHHWDTTSGPIPLSSSQYTQLQEFITSSQQNPPYYNVAQGAECTAWAVEALNQSGVIQPVLWPDLQPTDNSIAYNIFQTLVFNPYNGAIHQEYASIANTISSNLSALATYGQSVLDDVMSGGSGTQIINNSDGSSVKIITSGGDQETVDFYDPNGDQAASLQDSLSTDSGTSCTIDDSEGGLWKSINFASNSSGIIQNTTQDNYDNTSVLTSYNPNGSALISDYSGLDGTGTLTETDQENIGGTSDITTYNPNVSPVTSITNDYDGPDGTGDLTETTQDNSDGSVLTTTYGANNSSTSTYSGPPGSGISNADIANLSLGINIITGSFGITRDGDLTADGKKWSLVIDPNSGDDDPTNYDSTEIDLINTIPVTASESDPSVYWFLTTTYTITTDDTNGTGFYDATVSSATVYPTAGSPADAIALALDDLTPGTHTATITFNSTAENYLLDPLQSIQLPTQTLIVTETVACYLAGTRIATSQGEVLIEILAVGDLVCARQAGYAKIIWMGHRQIDCARHPKPEDVCVAARNDVRPDAQ